jgi:hypothetical protein
MLPVFILLLWYVFGRELRARFFWVTERATRTVLDGVCPGQGPTSPLLESAATCDL